MLPGSLVDGLSPHARVATAVLPFAAVMVTRVVWGKSRIMGWLITISTVWFAINVLMAPYSARMLQDIRNVTLYLP